MTPGQVSVGDQIPGFVITPTPLTIFLFGAAYWTAHRTHYDDPFARSEGYEGVLVPGPLMNAYLIRAVVDWTGDASLIRRFASRNLAIAQANDALSVSGVVMSVDDATVGCDLMVTSSGREIVSASVVLQFPFERAVEYLE